MDKPSVKVNDSTLGPATGSDRPENVDRSHPLPAGATSSVHSGAPEGPGNYPSDEEEYGDEQPQFPVTHEITLKDHTKVVSALTLDPSGARIVSGSHDYDCKLWDFGGMDMRCKPFKSWEPAGTYYAGFYLSPMPLRAKLRGCRSTI